MRELWKRLLPAALAVGVVTGCAGGSGVKEPPVREHWEVLRREERLPAVGSRWYPQRVEELIPRSDYGELVPFAGAVFYVTYPGALEEAAYPTTLYGLMTLDGAVVLDPVCTSIEQMSYSEEDGTTVRLPVWKLTRADPEGAQGEAVALAAQDGSWSTGFRYWGACASPVGVFAGGQDGLCQLEEDGGTQQCAWSWEELGVNRPENFPWFTGDAYTAARWTGEALFLGVWGVDWDTARLLHPETGEVETMPAQTWYGREEEYYLRRGQDQWETQAQEDGTVVVSRGEESFRFASPLPADRYPVVWDGRVVFETYEYDDAYQQVAEKCRFAVTDLEGTPLLPAQAGQLEVLRGAEEAYFAVRSAQGADWSLYAWDGTPAAVLPGEADSWCWMSGPLAEVRSPEGAAYYRPDTGECVFRTWFTLEDRMGNLPFEGGTD